MWKFLVLTACLSPPDSRCLDKPHCNVVRLLLQVGAERALAWLLDCGGHRCESLAPYVGGRTPTLTSWLVWPPDGPRMVIRAAIEYVDTRGPPAAAGSDEPNPA